MAADVLQQLGRAALEFLTASEYRNVRWSFDHDGPDGARWGVRDALVKERLGVPYEVLLELESADAMANPASLLAMNAVLGTNRSGHMDQLCGVVTSVRTEPSFSGEDSRRAAVTMKPALSLLHLQSDCRVFQAMTVPEIVEAVLKEALGKYGRDLDAGGLTAEYATREYVVQYRESDLAFVSRLLQSEGICYHFSHPPVEDEGALPVELLHLVDDTTPIEPGVSEDGEAIPILARATDLGDVEAIYRFSPLVNVTSTASHMRAYDWTQPALNLEAKLEGEGPDGISRETYVPDEVTFVDYATPAYGGDDIKARMQFEAERHVGGIQLIHGASVVTAMRPGLTFDTTDDSFAPGRYLVTAVTHLSGPPPGGEKSQTYHNRFECIPVEVPFRPQVSERRPRIHGIQTALVVGEAEPDPKHEKIYVDEHGRIKVQFQWDRLGERTEKSSCFLRVMTPWAGNGYGVAFIPRVGMEVVVSFIEGDPDRPVVTGCLYNGDNAFPLTDAEATQSLIRTKSETTAGFNEIRLEDKDDHERIFVHAQKDYTEVVENDHDTTVHNDQTQLVDGHQKQTVKKSQRESVYGNQFMSVGANRTKKVKKDETVTIEGNQIIKIKGSQSVEMMGESEVEGAGFAGGGLNITGDLKVATDPTIEMKTKDSLKLQAGDTFIEITPESITLQVDGGAKIVLDTSSIVGTTPDGTKLQLDANALVEASGKAKMQLDDKVAVQSMAGSKLALDDKAVASSVQGGKLALDMNAAMKGLQATVEGSLQAELKGGTGSTKADPVGVTISGPLVKIN